MLAKKFRAGEYRDPKTNDPEFTTEAEARTYCERLGKQDDTTAYAVWDDTDEVIYLYFDYQGFVPE